MMRWTVPKASIEIVDIGGFFEYIKLEQLFPLYKSLGKLLTSIQFLFQVAIASAHSFGESLLFCIDLFHYFFLSTHKTRHLNLVFALELVILSHFRVAHVTKQLYNWA